MMQAACTGPFSGGTQSVEIVPLRSLCLFLDHDLHQQRKEDVKSTCSTDRGRSSAPSLSTRSWRSVPSWLSASWLQSRPKTPGTWLRWSCLLQDTGAANPYDTHPACWRREWLRFGPYTLAITRCTLRPAPSTMPISWTRPLRQPQLGK